MILQAPEYTLIHGDCYEVVPRLSLARQVALITDPPYGDNHDTNYVGKFSGGVAAQRNWYEPIEGDDQPFDPSPWLKYPNVVLFGANRFSDRLSTGTIFVWDKRTLNANKNVMSDAEIAWWNRNRDVYIFQHTWDGFNRASERNTAYHPTQKPVALFTWVLERLNLPVGTTILDPFMGAGPIGVAAVQMGYSYVGIEINRRHYTTAAARIEDAARAAAGKMKLLTGSPDDYAGSPLYDGSVF